ncbi:hypothetical protein [Gordonia shandongensis]|uniref:hypothetical protein n=1 Tax=Gordonia shandongensis TaxID=376351 RepID=UPI00041119E5|nr:hypothetical protein [Gordonia shandongensis]
MIDIAPRRRPQRPDPKDRPKLVVWSLRLWLIAGSLLVTLGVLGVLVDTFFTSGFDFGVVGIDILIVLLGALYYVMGANSYRGVLQWRSSFSALTCVVVPLVLAMAIGFGASAGMWGLWLVLVAAVIGLAGTYLAYRPAADRWFRCQLGDCDDATDDATDDETDARS